MDNFDTQETPESEEMELSHSDKMIGVITEPSATFSKIAKFPPKTMDWFLPMLILLVLVSLSRIVVMNNEEIAFQTKQKMRENIEKALGPRVESGQMTQEQVDQLVDRQTNYAFGTIGKVIQTVSILVIGFIIFFIIAGIYFIFAKFILKGDGTYTSALSTTGLVSYISMIQVIVAALLSLLMSKMLTDTSVASFLGSDKSTIVGFILSKLDIFSIWAYAVTGIGLAKMFKSDNVKKYLITIFAIWILGSLLFFFLAKVVPFLKSFGM
jgi:hypothetical protein